MHCLCTGKSVWAKFWAESSENQNSCCRFGTGHRVPATGLSAHLRPGGWGIFVWMQIVSFLLVFPAFQIKITFCMMLFCPVDQLFAQRSRYRRPLYDLFLNVTCNFQQPAAQKSGDCHLEHVPLAVHPEILLKNDVNWKLLPLKTLQWAEHQSSSLSLEQGIDLKHREESTQ